MEIEIGSLLTAGAILFGMGLTLPLLIKFAAGVSQSMSQASINASQENTRISKEG